MNCNQVRLSALALLNATNRRFSTGLQRFKISNYYDILGVNQNCSSKEIKTAYVKLCKEYHPDKKPQDPNQHRRFVTLNEAYKVLSKPETRRQYDSSLSSPYGRPYPYYGYPQPARPAWRDETIWSMRDKTKDGHYQGKSQHGPMGDGHLGKQYTVLLCIIIVMMGSLLHVMFYNFMSSLYDKRLKEKELNNFIIYTEVRRKAMENSKQQQMELMFGKRTEPNDSTD